jgi:hypothetical protein
MPNATQLYDYLEKSGILANGSPEEIRQVKKEYWNMYRKEWRKQQRTKCKSCTVFFTPSEYKVVTAVLTGRPKNVADFVKQAALNAAQNNMSINKALVGRIREAFFASYAAIEAMTSEAKITDSMIDLEQKVLNLIK